MVIPITIALYCAPTVSLRATVACTHAHGHYSIYAIYGLQFLLTSVGPTVQMAWYETEKVTSLVARCTCVVVGN